MSDQTPAIPYANRSLVRPTLGAAAVALLVLVAIVWPAEFGLGTVTPGLRFRLASNPGPAPTDILWDRVPDRGDRVDWTILSPTGRRLASGVFRCSGAERDTNALATADRLPTGVYWVRLQQAGRQGAIPMIVIR